jgi:hypothetical protein
LIKSLNDIRNGDWMKTLMRAAASRMHQHKWPSPRNPDTLKTGGAFFNKVWWDLNEPLQGPIIGWFLHRFKITMALMPCVQYGREWGLNPYFCDRKFFESGTKGVLVVIHPSNGHITSIQPPLEFTGQWNAA